MKTKIILLVGASGVGKDTLLKYSQEVMQNEINFVKRYITRELDENERNYYLDKYSFNILQKNDFFICSWSAHENLYGISKRSIKDGLNLISISRAQIKSFEAVFDEVYTINVTLPKEELKNRLLKRGRENIEQIKKRLERSYEKLDARNLIEFDNSFEINISKDKFIEQLKYLQDD